MSLQFVKTYCPNTNSNNNKKVVIKDYYHMKTMNETCELDGASTSIVNIPL